MSRPPRYTLTDRLDQPPQPAPSHRLALTAAQRQRSRSRLETPEGDILLYLPRGTVLQPGDWLQDATGQYQVQILPQSEQVYWVTAPTPLLLLRGAYHLGNRHVPLEVSPEGLRLEPDPVLKALLEQLGLHIEEQYSPFQPETGAYGSLVPSQAVHTHAAHTHSIHTHSTHTHSAHTHSIHTHSIHTQSPDSQSPDSPRSHP